MDGYAGTEEEKKALLTAPSEAMDAGVSIEKKMGERVKVINSLAQHDSATIDKYNALVDRHNALFADYKDYVQRVGIQLAQIGQANRVSNALAIYALMPKYQPVQLPRPPVFAPALEINCTSRTTGTTVYTDCH